MAAFINSCLLYINSLSILSSAHERIKWFKLRLSLQDKTHAQDENFFESENASHGQRQLSVIPSHGDHARGIGCQISCNQAKLLMFILRFYAYMKPHISAK
jgi:hypothetical protein